MREEEDKAEGYFRPKEGVGAANTHYKSEFFQKAYAHYIRERREYHVHQTVAGGRFQSSNGGNYSCGAGVQCPDS